MYSMMIVDKEENSLEVIKGIVKRYWKKIEITGTGRNGQEAMEMMREEFPDILMISVRLEDISGLDVVRQIRKRGKDVYVILDSAYDYYDFVKEGLVLKVFDYILKPINEGLLLPVINRILDEIKAKELRASREAEYRRIYGQMHEFSENSFLYGIMFNERPSFNIKRHMECLGLSEKGYIVNIEIDWEKSEFAESAAGLAERMYPVIKAAAAPYGNSAVGPRIMHRVAVYISPKTEAYEKTGIETMKQLARNISMKLKEELGLCVAVGIGKIKKAESLYDSYEEALKSLRYKGDEQEVHISEIEDKSIDQERYAELENKLLEGIRFGKETAQDYFSELMDCFKTLDEVDIRNKIMEILVLACCEIRMGGQNEDEYINYDACFKEMLAVEREDLWAWGHRKFEYIIKAARSSRSGKKSDTVKDALHYISEHFTRKISLSEIADYVGVSSQHLSKLFKEETGSNYVDYLTGLRIEEAKQYLRNGSRTVNEICFLVGYEDPNYFSRLFKKTVGISPTEFIQSEPDTP